MEAWATVVIVLVSNAIIGAVSVLTVRRQLKHSAEQFKMQQEDKREADEREWKREVRDEPLVKLRDELARMAGMLRFAIDLEIQASDKVDKESDKIMDGLDEAMKDWDAYIKSGEFFRTLRMQYNYDLTFEAHDILMDYMSAYNGIRRVWSGGKKEIDKAIKEAINIVQRNDVRVSEVQSQIIKLREGL